MVEQGRKARPRRPKARNFPFPRAVWAATRGQRGEVREALAPGAAKLLEVAPIPGLLGPRGPRERGLTGRAQVGSLLWACRREGLDLGGRLMPLAGHTLRRQTPYPPRRRPPLRFPPPGFPPPCACLWPLPPCSPQASPSLPPPLLHRLAAKAGSRSRTHRATPTRVDTRAWLRPGKGWALPCNMKGLKGPN